MTHVESQDLLLELAYGELDAQRAAEVASHVEGCAECRKEKAALDEMRRMAAPLRDLEEPPPGFDDRILAAARAQAQLDHEGNVGQVIEVTGSVRPLGVEAARIDAHGPVKARPTRRERPRWIVRAALGGSVAAAAALALVVSNTLETRRNLAKSNAARGDEYAIRVPTTADSLDSALRDAEAKRDKDLPEMQKLETPPAAPPAAGAEKRKAAELRVQPQKSPKKAGTSGGRIEGAGGDALGKVASKDIPASPRESDAARGAARVPTGSPSLGARAPAPAAPESTRAQSSREREVSSVVSEGTRNKQQGAVAAAPPAEAPPAASGVEASAQQARHAGNYTLAASLYRNAAELRQGENDAGGAAWNLAHAVECLSAVGQFDEARRVRDELARLYPSEATALSAARRALREVDLPAAAPAQKNP